VAELVTLQDDYRAWLDSLPNNLAESVTVEALRTICDLDLSGLDGLEPPRGFGRGLRAMPSHVPTPVDRRSVRRRRG
jgi:hypothetical protein